MERILIGIAQINFHQDLSAITDENSVPNFCIEPSSSMSTSENLSPSLEELTTTVYEQVDGNEPLNERDAMEGDSGWEEVEEDEEQERRNKKSYTFAERRQMPTRASKETSLLGIKRRTIMKPTKRAKTPQDFKNLKPADIRKIYLNKKLTNFKPSSLETIFEESSSSAHNNEQDYLQRLMGRRKIKRSLSCSDGFRYSKSLVNKRRAKIKKTFGKRFALKKISLDDFLMKLNNNIEKTEDPVPSKDDKNAQDNKNILEQMTTEDSSSEMLVSNISENIQNDSKMSDSFTNEAPETNFTTNMSNM